MQLTLEISAEQLARDVFTQTYSHDDAFEFIRALDLEVADCGFTERLAKHFIAELAKEAKAAGEPFNVNELAPPT